MSLIEKFIPAKVRDTLNKIFPDADLRRDLSLVLSEATPLFKAAGENQATEQNLRSVFNDVSLILPLIQKFLDKGKLPGTFEAISLAATYGPVFSRMNSNPLIETAFKNPGPELTAIYDKLQDKDNVQQALKRVLLKPAGQEVLTLQEDNGKFYAAESLSGAGIKFPLREDIYRSVLAARNPPPKGPAGPGV